MNELENNEENEDWKGLSVGEKLNRFLEENPDATPSEIKQFADKYHIKVSFSWSDDTEDDLGEANSEKMCYVAEELKGLTSLENANGPEKVEDEL